MIDTTIHEEAIAQMRRAGGTWAAYQNVELGHSEMGHLKFLKVGPDCTYKQPPKRLPDMPGHINWRYWYCGTVDNDQARVRWCGEYSFENDNVERLFEYIRKFDPGATFEPVIGKQHVWKITSTAGEEDAQKLLLQHSIDNVIKSVRQWEEKKCQDITK